MNIQELINLLELHKKSGKEEVLLTVLGDSAKIWGVNCFYPVNEDKIILICGDYQ